MKSIKMPALVLGLALIVGGSLYAAKKHADLKTPSVVKDYTLALSDVKKDQVNARVYAQKGNWGQALWHAQDSATARKTLIQRLFEPIAADFGKADDGRKEIYKNLAAYMKLVNEVFDKESDILDRLASQDLLSYKLHVMDKRLMALREAIELFEKESYSKAVARLAKQHGLEKIFTQELVNRLETTKKTFVVDAQHIMKAIEKEVAVLRAEMAKKHAERKARRAGQQRGAWVDVMTYDDAALGEMLVTE